MKRLILICLTLSIFSSCSVQRKFAKVAEKQVLTESALNTAHIGISIFDADKQEYIYEHQGNKFFIPASNTKLLMCYAAMKYLGDSITAFRMREYANEIYLDPTGDPTLLHPDFKSDHVLTALRAVSAKKKTYAITNVGSVTAWGSGWSWSDYDADYMAERSVLPVYGNVVSISGRTDSVYIYPKAFSKFTQRRSSMPLQYVNQFTRKLHSNAFEFTATGKSKQRLDVPFITSHELSVQLLDDTVHFDEKWFLKPGQPLPVTMGAQTDPAISELRSQKTDSLLKITMHRSDNFFAEQTLIMIGSKILGYPDDRKTIDTLLKTDYADLPQKPKWVDGSGLSRYNLVSPEDFVTVLNKMNKEFDWKRIETILPTGGEGTLSSYYKKYAGKIYAKTGTLSNNIALSGFLLTDKGKKLIFSVIINNHQAPTATIRKGVENMLGWLIEHY